MPKLESALGYSAWEAVAWKIYGVTVDRDVLDNNQHLKLGLIRSISHKFTQEAVQLMEEPLDIIYNVADILGSPSALTMEINRLLDLLEIPKARKDVVANCILVKYCIGIIKQTKQISLWGEETYVKMVSKSFNGPTRIQYHDSLAKNLLTKKSRSVAPLHSEIELAEQRWNGAGSLAGVEFDPTKT